MRGCAFPRKHPAGATSTEAISSASSVGFVGTKAPAHYNYIRIPGSNVLLHVHRVFVSVRMRAASENSLDENDKQKHTHKRTPRKHTPAIYHARLYCFLPASPTNALSPRKNNQGSVTSNECWRAYRSTCFKTGRAPSLATSFGIHGGMFIVSTCDGGGGVFTWRKAWCPHPYGSRRW